MNKKITIELPYGTLCCFVGYVYSAGTSVLMGTTAVGSDDLDNGHKICAGADRYEEQEDKQ